MCGPWTIVSLKINENRLIWRRRNKRWWKKLNPLLLSQWQPRQHSTCGLLCHCESQRPVSIVGFEKEPVHYRALLRCTVPPTVPPADLLHGQVQHCHQATQPQTIHWDVMWRLSDRHKMSAHSVALWLRAFSGRIGTRKDHICFVCFWDSRISNVRFPCIKCEIHKYTTTKILKRIIFEEQTKCTQPS